MPCECAGSHLACVLTVSPSPLLSPLPPLCPLPPRRRSRPLQRRRRRDGVPGGASGTVVSSAWARVTEQRRHFSWAHSDNPGTGRSGGAASRSGATAVHVRRQRRCGRRRGRRWRCWPCWRGCAAAITWTWTGRQCTEVQPGPCSGSALLATRTATEAGTSVGVLSDPRQRGRRALTLQLKLCSIFGRVHLCLMSSDVLS